MRNLDEGTVADTQNNVWAFADDEGSKVDLEILLLKLKTGARKVWLKANEEKTKFLLILENRKNSE